MRQAIATLGGRVGGLVLCAARGPIHPDPVEIVQTNHDASVRNALGCEAAFVEWASVVLLSSTAGFRSQHRSRWLSLLDEPYGGGKRTDLWAEIATMSPQEAYTLSKWAVNRSMLRLGRRLAGQRVRVNCVAPGPILTRMSEPLWRHRPEEWSDLVKESPVGMPCEADDVAAVVEWLCTEAARMVFGSFLHVDGGWRLRHVD